MQIYNQLGDLVGTEQIPINSTLVFSHSAIDRPLYIRSGANSIKWSYQLNTQSTPTIGGEVIQILSCFVGPITIQGMASGMNTDEKDRLSMPAGWADNAFTPADEMSTIVKWFVEYMHKAGGGRKRRIEEAIKFQYPARDWTFWIQVTDLQGFDLQRDQVAIPWSITAEVIDDPGLDYFVSETMSQYTDSLTSRASLQVAISKDFGFLTNPYINPALNPEVSAADLGARMGDNFQALVAAWLYGDFNVLTSGFSSLSDPKRQTGVDSPYDYYTQLVGGTYLGDPSKIRSDYNAPFTGSGSQTIESGGYAEAEAWMSKLLSCLGAPQTQENVCFLRVWAAAEGGHTHNTAKFNWLNHSFENQPGAKRAPGIEQFAAYDTLENGVRGLCNFLKKPHYKAIVEGFRSGNVIRYPGVADALYSTPGSPGWNASSDYSEKLFTRAEKCVAENLKKTGHTGQYQDLLSACVSISNMTLGYDPTGKGIPGSGHGKDLDTYGFANYFDCSSATSKVLRAANMFDSKYAIVSGEFATSWGDPGEGKFFTVWANDKHVWIQLKNYPYFRLDTSPYGDTNTKSGPRLRKSSRPTSGFTPRHYPGL